jgi:hypothetical protein
MHGLPGEALWIVITIEPHAGIPRRCSRCQKPAPGYDRLPQRRWLFVPLWESPPTFATRHGEWSVASMGS